MQARVVVLAIHTQCQLKESGRVYSETECVCVFRIGEGVKATKGREVAGG